MTISYNHRKKFHNKLKTLSKLLPGVEAFTKYKKSKKSASNHEIRLFHRTLLAVGKRIGSGLIPPKVVAKHKQFLSQCAELGPKVLEKLNQKEKQDVQPN